MADGWLFRLRSTLGARHAVPAWPASSPFEERAVPSSAAPGEWPALRETAASNVESDAFGPAELDPASLRKP